MAKILLAEDDQSMCDFITMALEKAGHSVTATQDGLEALSALNQNPDYDLLLSDVVMPGMDGIELSRAAMKKCPELKVMFITGFAAVAAKKKNQSAPQAPMVSKPFHLNDLVQKVEKLLAA